MKDVEVKKQKYFFIFFIFTSLFLFFLKKERTDSIKKHFPYVISTRNFPTSLKTFAFAHLYLLQNYVVHELPEVVCGEC